MKLIQKIKNFYFIFKERLKYKKFKDCTLPYPFYDKKRNVFEWVSYSLK